MAVSSGLPESSLAAIRCNYSTLPSPTLLATIENFRGIDFPSLVGKPALHVEVLSIGLSPSVL